METATATQTAIKNITELRRRNKAEGQHWFSPWAMRLFGTEILKFISLADGGAVLVHSDNGGTVYKVTRFRRNGLQAGCGEPFGTRAEAEVAAAEVAGAGAPNPVCFWDLVCSETRNDFTGLAFHIERSVTAGADSGSITDWSTVSDMIEELDDDDAMEVEVADDYLSVIVRYVGTDDYDTYELVPVI